MLNLYPRGQEHLFDEVTAPIGPCWTCTWYGLALSNAGSGARCRRPNGNPSNSDAENGCAFFTREPGCDDEPWTPPGWRPMVRHQGPWVTGPAAEPPDPTRRR